MSVEEELIRNTEIVVVPAPHGPERLEYIPLAVARRLLAVVEQSLRDRDSEIVQEHIVEHRVGELREALSDLLEVIEEEHVVGTCAHNACHWPAVKRQAQLAADALEPV